MIVADLIMAGVVVAFVIVVVLLGLVVVRLVRGGPTCIAAGCDRAACFAPDDGGPGGLCPLHAEADPGRAANLEGRDW